MIASTHRVKKMPQPGIKFYKKGLSHYKQGNYDQSITYFKKAVAKDNNFAKAWKFQGLAFSAKAEEKEAIECYDQSIDINPKSSSPWIYKGNSFLKLGKYSDALLFYEKAIEIAPRNDLAWSYKGKALSILCDEKEAIECFNKSLEIRSKDSWTLNNKGNSCIKLGRYQEAISCYESATNLNSKNVLLNAWSWANKGIALYKLHNYREADNSLDKALEFFSYNGSIGRESINPSITWYYRGHAQNGLGNVDSANECYHKAHFYGIKRELERTQEPIYDILLKPEKIKPLSIDLEHTYIQYLLLDLGAKWDFDVWIAANDQGKEVNGIQLKDMPRFKKELYLNDDQFTDTVKYIDVVWLKDDKVVSAFEVENTTSIFSGLLRMLDLIVTQPEFLGTIYIVASDERKDEVFSQMIRPVFLKLLQKPSHEICKYISSNKLENFMQIHKSVLKHLNNESLSTISESCKLSDSR
jgi:tetratricopeptide (TPR) repeat protein